MKDVQMAGMRVHLKEKLKEPPSEVLLARLLVAQKEESKVQQMDSLLAELRVHQ